MATSSAAISPAGYPGLGNLVAVPAGDYPLGEPGRPRVVSLSGVLLGRHPVTNADARRFVADAGVAVEPALQRRLEAEVLAGHPVTGLTFAQAELLCRWAGDVMGVVARLPTGTEWEAAARGCDGRTWPWGPHFDAGLCACVEAGCPGTAPVTAHPGGAGPTGAEQLAGNVWEWVSDPPDRDGWRAVRGGCYLDHAWGLRASRVLPADPDRATYTTGLRIAVDIEPTEGRRG